MSAGPFRLAPERCVGSALDRERPVRFKFDGRAYDGFHGDTLASALLANGVRTVARSFKFHRPRGIYTGGSEEPNAFVQLGEGAAAIPSVRATTLELFDELNADPRARRRFDIGRLLDFTAPLWAAGFYNKTFMWPGWRSYEWLIRRLAGFGHVASDRDPDRYDVRNHHCDVLVVGGGVAGLTAASDAAQRGERVVVVEQSPRLGGRGAWDGSAVEGEPASEWVRAKAHRLGCMTNVSVMTRTCAVGFYERDVVTLLESIPRTADAPDTPRERYWIVRARRVILATGALEQPLVFCNNDRPGIIMAGAAHQFLREYAVACGRRVVVATNNDCAYDLACDLKHAHVDVVAVADSRVDVDARLRKSLQALSIPLHDRTIPVDTGGFSALREVTLGTLSSDARQIDGSHRYACDALAISGGWNPALHLYSQATGKLEYASDTRTLVAMSSHPVAVVASAVPSVRTASGVRVSPVGRRARQWVDLRHDVTVADLELACRENYTAVEHLKRYTTLGMAPDQGKTSNLLAVEILANFRGVQPKDVGHTTYRPPYLPITLGAIAGRATGSRFAPARLLPMHDWHVEYGALMQDFGEWRRPALYQRSGESRHEAMMREARAVRTAAGLLDYSPLGKIEVHGPDALEFLNRFYINDLTTLKPRRARYCLMLRESGVIFDDGTVLMLSPDHFLITTTSGNAGRVAAWFQEWHQCEWPSLRVTIIPVTEAWACLSLAGPRSREILASVAGNIDVSAVGLPLLGMCEGRLLDTDARIYRVSFTGELSYEINVRASAAQRVWDVLIEAGRPHGLQPFGLDALLLMRVEKGHLHIGTDTDGATVPDDVGWGKVAANKRSDYIGKRSLSLPEHRRSDRLQLIGLRGDSGMIAGSHVRLAGSTVPTDGWVTSTGTATLTGEPIALAMVRGGRARIDARVSIHDGDATTRATIVTPPFYDPSGERMNA